jgi:penicillin-binding protein 1A
LVAHQLEWRGWLRPHNAGDNGGKLARPYAVLELLNSRGESIYQRERDEPPAPQAVSRRVAEQMNQMMQAVITEGTGKRAALDFTTVAGKTGTRSSYRDAWFVGFTGALVAGVWVGHDFRPMSSQGSGVTGGSLPAQAWHTFMAVARGTGAIPPIPGLAPNPQQLAQSVAEPNAPEASRAGAPAQRSSPTKNLASEETRQCLRLLSEALRRAAATATDPGTERAPHANHSAGHEATAPGDNRRAEAKGGTTLPKP